MAVQDFCTPSDVKKFLDIASTTTADDPLLQMLVTAVSKAFQNCIQRDILSTAYTELRDGTGSGTLVLRNFPVTAVSALQLGQIVAKRVPLVYQTDYVFSQWSIKLLNGGRFPVGPASIYVAYTAGAQTVPADLSEKAAKTAALRYKQLQRIGQNSKTLAQETVTFDTSNWPKDVADVLENYKSRILVPA